MNILSNGSENTAHMVFTQEEVDQHPRLFSDLEAMSISHRTNGQGNHILEMPRSEDENDDWEMLLLKMRELTVYQYIILKKLRDAKEVDYKSFYLSGAKALQMIKVFYHNVCKEPTQFVETELFRYRIALHYGKVQIICPKEMVGRLIGKQHVLVRCLEGNLGAFWRDGQRYRVEIDGFRPK